MEEEIHLYQYYLHISRYYEFSITDKFFNTTPMHNPIASKFLKYCVKWDNSKDIRAGWIEEDRDKEKP